MSVCFSHFLLYALYYSIYLLHFMVFLHDFWSLKAPIHDIGSERRDEQIIQNVSLLVGLEQQGE